MRDQALRKRLAEADACPSCGRDAVGTVTGQCIHCLQPLGHGSYVDPEKILKLVELERTRGRVRNTGGRRHVRVVRTLVIWGAVALVLFLLFEVTLRWMTSFFARGLVRA